MAMLPMCPRHTRGTCPQQEEDKKKLLGGGGVFCYETEHRHITYTHSHIHTVHICNYATTVKLFDLLGPTRVIL